jgi:hypothetical protein
LGRWSAAEPNPPAQAASISARSSARLYPPAAGGGILMVISGLIKQAMDGQRAT